MYRIHPPPRNLNLVFVAFSSQKSPLTCLFTSYCKLPNSAEFQLIIKVDFESIKKKGSKNPHNINLVASIISSTVFLIHNSEELMQVEVLETNWHLHLALTFQVTDTACLFGSNR